jgi:hypothetical protein
MSLPTLPFLFPEIRIPLSLALPTMETVENVPFPLKPDKTISPN